MLRFPASIPVLFAVALAGLRGCFHAACGSGLARVPDADQRDAHLRGVDFPRLTLLLRDFHVAAPVIATPREIVRKFFR